MSQRKERAGEGIIQHSDCEGEGGSAVVTGRWLWVMGAGLGAVMALLSVLGDEPATPVASDVVATVNGSPIARADYQRALAALEASHDGELDPELRRRVLDRMIEQELLVQYGLELQLAERDPKVRLDLSTAVIDLLSARGAHLADPSEQELRRFYRERAAFLTRAESVAVEVAFVAARDGETEEQRRARADNVASRLRDGEPISAMADEPELEVPRGMLPIAKLRDYLGDSAARELTRLQVGEVTEPLNASGGYRIVKLVDRRAAVPEPFEQVRERVIAAWRREAGDRRLRSFLDARREASQIVLSEVL